jgi:hypothetical protein
MKATCSTSVITSCASPSSADGDATPISSLGGAGPVTDGAARGAGHRHRARSAARPAARLRRPATRDADRRAGGRARRDGGAGPGPRAPDSPLSQAFSRRLSGGGGGRRGRPGALVPGARRDGQGVRPKGARWRWRARFTPRRTARASSSTRPTSPLRWRPAGARGSAFGRATPPSKGSGRERWSSFGPGRWRASPAAPRDLPPATRVRLGLPPLAEALRRLHAPGDEAWGEAAEGLARARQRILLETPAGRAARVSAAAGGRGATDGGGAGRRRRGGARAAGGGAPVRADPVAGARGGDAGRRPRRAARDGAAAGRATWAAARQRSRWRPRP